LAGFNYHRLHAITLGFLLIIYAGTWLTASAQQAHSTDHSHIIQNIYFEGNKITRERILLREVMFSPGDTLSAYELEELLEKSRKNLMNTQLFNFVSTSINIEENTATGTNILFTLTERWYIWPWPIIEFADRNFNTWWQENRDLSRMSYGVVLKWENFRGRKESLEITTRFGYIELYGFDYTIPYLNKKETLGLGIGASYGRTKEAPVMNMDDKLVYYRDDKEYVAEGVSSFLSLTYRKKIYNTHTIRAQYDWQNFQDTLVKINPDFTVDGKTTLQFLSLSYLFKSDHRDYKAYPLNGHYFDVEVVKRGFGVFDNNDLDVFYVLTTFRKYFQLGNRFYFASGLNSKFSNNSKQTFYMHRAIGYGRDIIRGYEYYVVNGNNFGIFKNNLKFALLPTREFNIDFIKSEKFSKVHYAFYLNAFFDLGFVDNFNPQDELNNTLENTLLIGYGLGIDFVTYYDLVFRFEYSFNRMNEHGFFLHFMAPI
jgi:outer membrane protein assembly factor BamA